MIESNFQNPRKNYFEAKYLIILESFQEHCKKLNEKHSFKIK